MFIKKRSVADEYEIGIGFGVRYTRMKKSVIVIVERALVTCK